MSKQLCIVPPPTKSKFRELVQGDIFDGAITGTTYLVANSGGQLVVLNMETYTIESPFPLEQDIVYRGQLQVKTVA